MPAGSVSKNVDFHQTSGSEPGLKGLSSREAWRGLSGGQGRGAETCSGTKPLLLHPARQSAARIAAILRRKPCNRGELRPSLEVTMDSIARYPAYMNNVL